MKSFSKKPKCEKCGSRNIARTYHKRELYGSRECVLGFGTHIEHHDLTCRACHYEWVEDVLGKGDE